MPALPHLPGVAAGLAPGRGPPRLGGVGGLAAAAALLIDVLGSDALHDPLTGLYNRRSFDEPPEQAAGRSRRYSWSFSLVLIDLDDFKRVNDELGHASGDALLRVIGLELRRALR